MHSMGDSKTEIQVVLERMISIVKKWKKKEMREKEKKNRDRENGKAVIVILSTVG